MTNEKTIPPLSQKAAEALDKELQNPDYKILDEETAHFEAAKALIKKETETGEPIFDRTNPADNILLTLVNME